MGHMRGMLQRIGPLLIIVLAGFALRCWRLDAVWHDHDHGVPHGYGIAILESVADGRWQDLPVLSFPTGARLLNPAGASYLWAMIAFFDRDSYSATFVSVLLSTLAIAATYAVARQAAGKRAGAAAAFVMATSPWSIFFARGTWMQGQLEFFGCITAWMVWIGVMRRDAWRVFRGFALAGVFMQTYLTAYGLAAQAALAGAWMRRQALRASGVRALAAGLALCAISAGAYVAVLLSDDGQGDVDVAAALTRSREAPDAFANPFGLSLDRAPILHALQLVSGGGYAAGAPAAHDIAFTAMEVLVGAGALVSVVRARTSVGHRLALVWFAAPVIVAMAVGLVYPLLGLGGRQYMLLTAPAGYVLAGVGADAILARLGRSSRAIVAPVALAGAVWALMSASLLGLRGEEDARLPFDRSRFEDFSLREQRELASTWRDSVIASSTRNCPSGRPASCRAVAKCVKAWPRTLATRSSGRYRHRAARASPCLMTRARLRTPTSSRARSSAAQRSSHTGHARSPARRSCWRMSERRRCPRRSNSISAGPCSATVGRFRRTGVDPFASPRSGGSSARLPSLMTTGTTRCL